MASSNYEIVTLAELKTYLGVGDTDAQANDFLQSLINSSSAKIENYCGRKFKLQSVSSEIHDSDGGGVLRPRYFPIYQLSTETSPTDAQKLAALQHRIDVTASWENVCDDLTHIIIPDDADLLMLHSEAFYGGIQTVKISYKAGWSTIPGEIVDVCREMIQRAWDKSKRGNNLLAKGSSSTSESGVTFGTSYVELWPQHKEVLDFYRLRHV